MLFLLVGYYLQCVLHETKGNSFPEGILPYVAYTGHAAGQGMVFVLSALNRVYTCNFRRVCPKQGLDLS